MSQPTNRVHLLQTAQQTNDRSDPRPPPSRATATRDRDSTLGAAVRRHRSSFSSPARRLGRMTLAGWPAGLSTSTDWSACPTMNRPHGKRRQTGRVKGGVGQSTSRQTDVRGVEVGGSEHCRIATVVRQCCCDATEPASTCPTGQGRATAGIDRTSRRRADGQRLSVASAQRPRKAAVALRLRRSPSCCFVC